MSEKKTETYMSQRFRGFMPVVVDVETGGFDSKKDALLEIAAVTLAFDENHQLQIHKTYHEHVEPFRGANLNPKSMEVTGIQVNNPFRFAKPEDEALQAIFQPIKKELREQQCQRAVLVGHNAAFDIGFLHAAMRRCHMEKSPFHLFTTFDTATLSAVAYGQTVLLRAAKAAGIEFDPDQAHSALYDAEKTAELFCGIVNSWPAFEG